MESKLHNYQFDYIKIKTKKINRETINWGMLNEHSTIRNAYVLSKNSGLQAKNFKLYIDKNDRAVIESSIPYLLHGHNYVKMNASELRGVIDKLECILEIDLYNAEIMQYEYGGYLNINSSAKNYIKKLVGIDGFALKYHSPYMKMYANGTTSFKIYDAVKNAKSKKTYRLGNYPTGGLIKFEIKTNMNVLHDDPIELMCLFDLDHENMMKESLNFQITSLRKIESLDISQMCNLSFQDILYAAIVNAEYQHKSTIRDYITKIIDTSNLSPSQKSKRRIAFRQLEQKFKTAQNN